LKIFSGEQKSKLIEMKTIVIVICSILLSPVSLFGQKINPLDYLNQTEESLASILKSKEIKYFKSTNKDQEKVVYIPKDEESRDFFGSLNLNVYFDNDTSYKLILLCENREIMLVRKRFGLDKTSDLIFPKILNYKSGLFYYIESEEGEYIRVEINNSASMERSSIIPVENILTKDERNKYLEILDPELPDLPRSKRKIMKYIYGAWLAVLVRSEYDQQIQQYQGEFLGIKGDSILLLNNGNQTTLNFQAIEFAGIYTHKNNPGKYVLFTILAYTPNIIAAITTPEYAGELLALGIPVAFVGLINILAEVGKKTPAKYYPGDINSITEMNAYARFPQGISDDINSFNQ